MIEFVKYLPKHVLSALKGLQRHMAMTISSVSAVSVTLLLMALFFVIAGNVENFTQHVEGDLKIHVAIDSIADQDAITAMEKEIAKMQDVAAVHFSSKEEELDALIKESGSVFQRYKDKNPMPNVFIVEVTEASKIPSVTKALNAIDGIEKAEYGGESIQHMIDTFSFIRSSGFIFVLALSLIALFLITNTIKMTIYTRNTELSIMRFVGANNAYIKTPFMMEGMCIGSLGAILPIALMCIGYSTLYHMLNGYFLSSMFVMQPLYPFLLQLSAVLVGSGALVGVAGSFLATTKYLRWRR